jgi:hypothetical protein
MFITSTIHFAEKLFDSLKMARKLVLCSTFYLTVIIIMLMPREPYIEFSFTLSKYVAQLF